MNEVLLIKKELEEKLQNVLDEEGLKIVKAQYLGRKGKITSLLRSISSLPQSERSKIGIQINELKEYAQKMFMEVAKKISFLQREKELAQKLDVALSVPSIEFGHNHPIRQTLSEIIDFFKTLGFQMKEGPEIEEEYYNFDALNIPKGHPARELHDTFYLASSLLLRTHTSPVQIRVMKECEPPLRIISSGRVYRRDQDASHFPMFHQVEGFLVDEDTSFSELKGVLCAFARTIFGDVKSRFRPSYFPFTEPSAEMDISCRVCEGKGCKVCKGTGWIEILGAGMIAPEVFKEVGYDTERFIGFAFGMGVERIAMIKYRIDDIRLFFENDLRFLEQF